MVNKSKNNSNPTELKNKRNLFDRKNIFWLIILIFLIIMIAVRHFKSSAFTNQNVAKPTLVVVAPAVSKNVPVYLTALGSVTPTYSVTVKTQIDGRLLSVLFKEGQMVKIGDLLAVVDPAPYEAQLIQYEGQLARDKALLANAKIDLQRYKTLWAQNSVAKQILDTQVSLVQQYIGTIKLDEGLLDGVKVNLAYTQITSPINGRVGLRLVDPGNFVQTTDTTGIAILNMLNPITVIFTLAEDFIPEVLKQINMGKTLTVKAYDRSQNTFIASGTLMTIDNQIDPTTGTVKLRAQFKNDDNRLFPNQFVNIFLLINTLQNAIVIPTSAIQNGVQKTYVYLLKSDSTVSVQPVVVGVQQGTFSTITSGISKGQYVVTEGVDKLANGAKVSVSTPAKPPTVVKPTGPKTT